MGQSSRLLVCLGLLRVVRHGAGGASGLLCDLTNVAVPDHMRTFIGSSGCFLFMGLHCELSLSNRLLSSRAWLNHTFRLSGRMFIHMAPRSASPTSGGTASLLIYRANATLGSKRSTHSAFGCLRSSKTGVPARGALGRFRM